MGDGGSVFIRKENIGRIEGLLKGKGKGRERKGRSSIFYGRRGTFLLLFESFNGYFCLFRASQQVTPTYYDTMLY